MSGAAPLDRLVALEAHRAGVGFGPDPARLADGWEYRFVADARRTEECVALYRELGFEATADPIGAPISGACEDCRLAAAFDFRALYTRRPGSARPDTHE